MLHYIILYYIVMLHYIILYYIVMLYCVILYYIILYYIILYYIILYYIILYYIILYYLYIIMGPPSYMRSVVDRNVVMRRIPVKVTLSLNFIANHARHDMSSSTNQSLHHTDGSGAASHPGRSASEKRAPIPTHRTPRGQQRASRRWRASAKKSVGTLLGLLTRSELQFILKP